MKTKASSSCNNNDLSKFYKWDSEGLTINDHKELSSYTSVPPGYFVANDGTRVIGVVRHDGQLKYSKYAGNFDLDADKTLLFFLRPLNDENPKEQSLRQKDWDYYITYGRDNFGVPRRTETEVKRRMALRSAKGKRHSIETKQKAIKMLKGGVRPDTVSDHLKVSMASLKRWMKQIKSELSDVSTG